MARVIHFEIHAQDLARARDFYGELFGWTFSSWHDGEYWLIEAAPGESIGGLMRRKGPPPVAGQPVNAFVSTVGVDDLEATLALAQRNGAHLSVPRMAVPGVGWLAYIADREGNILGLMQHDASAA